MLGSRNPAEWRRDADAQESLMEEQAVLARTEAELSVGLGRMGRKQEWDEGCCDRKERTHAFVSRTRGEEMVTAMCKEGDVGGHWE